MPAPEKRCKNTTRMKLIPLNNIFQPAYSCGCRPPMGLVIIGVSAGINLRINNTMLGSQIRLENAVIMEIFTPGR